MLPCRLLVDDTGPAWISRDQCAQRKHGERLSVGLRLEPAMCCC